MEPAKPWVSSTGEYNFNTDAPEQMDIIAGYFPPLAEPL